MPQNKRKIPRQATSAVAIEGPLPAKDDPLLGFAPYLHQAPRRNSITPALQRRFIATLAATGIVQQAARSIGKSMEALYKLRHRPGAEGFARAWDLATERGIDRLEDAALARAIEGEERMVVSAGQLVGTERRHNEALVMFFLRQRRARRYGADRPTPDAARQAEMVRHALAQARKYVSEHEIRQLEDLIPLLEHMVANRLAGRGFIDGIDRTKSLAENAEMFRARPQAAKR